LQTTAYGSRLAARQGQEELSREGQPLIHDITPDSVDVYFYPAELQRGEGSL
jgi:hypothetical protein